MRAGIRVISFPIPSVRLQQLNYTKMNFMTAGNFFKKEHITQEEATQTLAMDSITPS